MEDNIVQIEGIRSAANDKVATRPEFATLLGRVRGLRSEIEARALATEKAKRVPEETIEALREIGVFRAMQPQRFGGYEYGPAELAQIGFELGRACGSTGWCGTLATGLGWQTAMFSLEAQQEVWDDPDNILAGSYIPSPSVEEVDGGYKIAGRWPYSSGVDSAAWIILAGLIPNQATPPLEPAWFLVPARDVAIDHDSWNVSGLAGTGSKVVVISDPVFVPKHRMLAVSAIMSGQVPGLQVPGNRQARFGFSTFGPTGLVSPIVGMALGAIDAFTQTVSNAQRTSRSSAFPKISDPSLIARLIGQTSARIEAAQNLMLSSIGEGQEIVRAGGTLSIEQRVRIRRNHGFAARTSAEVVNDLFFKVGASAIDEKYIVQRLWRDANAAAQHASLDWDSLAALYGTQRLGLQPQGLF